MKMEQVLTSLDKVLEDGFKDYVLKKNREFKDGKFIPDFNGTDIMGGVRKNPPFFSVKDVKYSVLEKERILRKDVYEVRLEVVLLPGMKEDRILCCRIQDAVTGCVKEWRDGRDSAEVSAWDGMRFLVRIVCV